MTRVPTGQKRPPSVSAAIGAAALAALMLPCSSFLITGADRLASRRYQAWVESVNPACTLDSECYSFLAEDFAFAALLLVWSIACFGAFGVLLGAANAAYCDGHPSAHLSLATTAGLLVGSLSTFVDPTAFGQAVVAFIVATIALWTFQSIAATPVERDPGRE